MNLKLSDLKTKLRAISPFSYDNFNHIGKIVGLTIGSFGLFTVNQFFLLEGLFIYLISQKMKTTTFVVEKSTLEGEN